MDSAPTPRTAPGLAVRNSTKPDPGTSTVASSAAIPTPVSNRRHPTAACTTALQSSATTRFQYCRRPSSTTRSILPLSTTHGLTAPPNRIMTAVLVDLVVEHPSTASRASPIPGRRQRESRNGLRSARMAVAPTAQSCSVQGPPRGQPVPHPAARRRRSAAFDLH